VSDVMVITGGLTGGMGAETTTSGCVATGFGAAGAL
jgi:hypothetical protein